MDHYIDYDNLDQGYPGLFQEGNLNEEFPGSIAVASLNSFLHRAFYLKSTQQILEEIRGDAPTPWMREGNWYGVCAKSLFQPSDYVMRYLRPFLELFKKGPVLGLHVRSGGKTANWKDAGYFGVNPTVVKRNGPKIHQILARNAKTMLFLSTDSDEVEEFVRARYGRKVISVSSLPRNHVGKFPSEGSVMRSYLDLYLLGQCDYLFLTRRSGFSQMGLAMNAKHPEVFYFKVCVVCWRERWMVVELLWR